MPHHPPHPPHHGKQVPREEVQALAERLSPYVNGDAERWAKLILSDPGPGRLQALLTLAVLEKLDKIIEMSTAAGG